MIRILHTSDWHLGRAFHFYSLEQDQRHALSQILKELEQNYQAMVISGDIYDRAVPSVEAVQLFGDLLMQARALNLTCVIIPGNHDSAERLGFASAILARAGIHLRCDYTKLREPVTIKGTAGEQLDVFALPFVEPFLVRQQLGDDSITSVQLATQKAVERIREGRRQSIAAILLAHAFVGEKSQTSESERLLVGGTDRVPSGIFSGFDYVALGHLHRPQRVDSDWIRYSGSLLPYSFSEDGQQKQMIRIEIGNGPKPLITAIPIAPLRGISVIEDSFEAVLTDEKYEAQRADFVSVRLTDSDYHVETFYRIKQRFPLLCELRQTALEARPSDRADASRDIENQSPEEIIELFLDYFGWTDPSERKSAKELLIKGYRKAESQKRRDDR
ncbi:MAG: exonuclease SbcCD subunit D [Deltaproteobacteria bacterium]|nr:exonuclease SbcCD subunit D [Deltaproteobacteria bacterium]